jgi:hypothetical protein
MTRLDLVVWDTGDAAAGLRPRGFVDPFTGEVADAGDPAEVAAWYLAYRDFQETIARPAEAAALALLNRALTGSKTQIEGAAGRVYEIGGESQGAADGALAVTDAEALRADLDVLVSRGDLAAEAAEQAVKVETVTTYKPDLRRLRTMREQADVVGETVREYVVKQPRERKRPTVKRIA